MNKKRMALCGMVLLPHLCWGMEYTWETPTVNDWNIVIANGNLNYDNDAVIGNNGTSTMPEPAAISIEKGGTATITSQGLIHVIGRPTPSATTSWMYGIYAYSSTGGSTDHQITKATIDTDIEIDVESATTQHSGNETLGSALKISARGADNNAGDNALTQVVFNKKATFKINNKATSTDNNEYAKSMEGIDLFATGGGRNEVAFMDALTVEATASVEDRNVYGIHNEDHDPNGIGSSLTFHGDTQIKADSLHGGRVFGILAQAVGGTHTFTTEVGTHFQVTAIQKEGKNYSEAVKFNSREYGSKPGTQNVDIKGTLQALATGDYYASALNLNTSDQSQQQVHLGDDIQLQGKAEDYAYGIKAISGTHGNGSFVADGKTTIDITSNRSGYGIYSSVNDGHQQIQLNKGLTISLQSQEKTSVALYTQTDTPSADTNNYIQVEGETKITTPKDKGFVAFATGQGSYISINKNEQGLSQLSGKIAAGDKGHVEIYAVEPGSSYTGDIGSYNEGVSEFYISGQNSMFTGSTENVFDDVKPGILSVGVAKNAIWNVTEDASLSNLEVSQGGFVNLAHTEEFQTLLTENLSGDNGKFLLDIDASRNENNSDIILITNDFTGTHTLALNEVGHGDLNGAAGTVLARVKNNNGTFLAQDEEGTLYWQRYLLDKRETTDTSGAFTTDWYLKNIVPLSNPSTTVITAVTNTESAYTLWHETLDTLLQRMGELRFNPETEEDAVWFRMKGGEVGYSKHVDYTTRYRLYQLGYDTIAKKNEELVRYQGLALGYSKGNTSFHEGVGKSRILSLTLYNTDIRTTGHYLDVILSLSKGKYDSTGRNSKQESIQTHYKGRGLLAGVEYGRKKELKDNWYIEPQAQLTVGFMKNTNYVTNQNVEIHPSSIKSLIGRIGINVGKHLSDKSIVYGRLHLLHEFGGNYQVDLLDGNNILKYDGSLGRTWMKYAIGFAKTMSNDTSIYFDIENIFGNHMKKHWNWDVGIRYSF